MNLRQNPSKGSCLRFDYPISELAGEKYASDPQRVASHAFYPFVSYDKRTPRYRRINGKTRRMELKVRPIRYASHLDSAIYSYYAALLSEAYEPVSEQEGLQPSVIAYRKLGKSNIDFASDVFTIVKSEGNCCAMCLDIEKFFDSVDHKLLKEGWQDVIGQPQLPIDHYKVFRNITSYAHVDREELIKTLGASSLEGQPRLCTPNVFREEIRPLVEVNKTGKGIPQGSSISAILSNIYMIEFDKAMAHLCRQHKGHYRRYSDAILIITPPSLECVAHEFVKSQLRHVHLTANEKKSDICFFYIDVDGYQVCNKPLQYLGFTYDGDQVLIRSSTLSRYNRKLRKYIAASTRKASSCGDVRLRRRKAYTQFTMRGKRNFISYARRAHNIISQNHKSGIAGQIKGHWAMANQLLAEADAELAANAESKALSNLDSQG